MKLLIEGEIKPGDDSLAFVVDASEHSFIDDSESHYPNIDNIVEAFQDSYLLNLEIQNGEKSVGEVTIEEWLGILARIGMDDNVKKIGRVLGDEDMVYMTGITVIGGTA